MTYQDLLNTINKMTIEQRQQSVAIFVDELGEYRNIEPGDVQFSDETNDVLSPGQPFIVVW